MTCCDVARLRLVLAAFKRKKFVQIKKYREATKEGRRDENIKIVAQRKMGVVVKTEIS
jgi:hypothetical protein